MKRRLDAAGKAFLAWVVVSVVFVLTSTVLFWWRGADGFEAVLQTGHFSSLPVTMASVAATWLLAGSLLYLLAGKHVNNNNAFALAGFYLVALVYLNVLRERSDYGDIQHYLRAAESLFKNQPLPPQYLYPPLWATLLEPLVPLGETGMFVIIWLANLISLFAFYFLSHQVLMRYEFSSRLAALVTVGFLVVNTPLLRTLLYTQVNLHVLNFVFLSVLLFRRAPFLSALSLALAVHLKASPIVLLLAFLLERDWRWLGWFTLAIAVITLATMAANGLEPYAHFFAGAARLATERGIIFRENSFDGFFAAVGEFLNIGPGVLRVLVYASKAALAVFVLLVIRRSISQGTFHAGSATPRLHNSLPPLLILMTLVAPIVWEHHGIFLGIAFLLLLGRLESGAEWAWFGTAYLLEFLLPTFDFFPWSYGRLVAPLIVLGLMWRASGRRTAFTLFERATEELERIHLFRRGVSS